MDCPVESLKGLADTLSQGTVRFECGCLTSHTGRQHICIKEEIHRNLLWQQSETNTIALSMSLLIQD